MKSLALALCITLTGCGISTVHLYANATSSSQYWMYCDGANIVTPVIDTVLSAALTATVIAIAADNHMSQKTALERADGDLAAGLIGISATSIATSAAFGYYRYVTACPPPKGYVEETKWLNAEWKCQKKEYEETGRKKDYEGACQERER